jgi:hypothetical protein
MPSIVGWVYKYVFIIPIIIDINITIHWIGVEKIYNIH